MSEKETVLDAVNAALSGDTPAGGADDELDTDAPETPDNEGDVGEGDSGDTEGDGETAEDGEGEAEETDAEAEARGAERDPTTGKFVKKGEEPKPEGEKPKVEAKKEKDHLNDPIPENLKKEATERFKAVVNIAKRKNRGARESYSRFQLSYQGRRSHWHFARAVWRDIELVGAIQQPRS